MLHLVRHHMAFGMDNAVLLKPFLLFAKCLTEMAPARAFLLGPCLRELCSLERMTGGAQLSKELFELFCLATRHLHDKDLAFTQQELAKLCTAEMLYLFVFARL